MEKARLKWWLQTLVVLALGIYLIMWPWNDWPFVKGLPLFPELLQLGLPKVGDALVIAGVIALLVDRAVKRDLLLEFASDISHHMVGNLLPPELREHIRNYLKVALVRKNWSINYESEIQENSTKTVKVTTRSTYEMENRSAAPKKYKHEFLVEQRTVGKTAPQIVSFAVISPNSKECYELSEHDSSTRPANFNGWLVLSKEVTIPPPPHAVYTFVAECTEFFPENYSDSFVALYPALKTTVTVCYPKDELVVNLNLSCDDAGYPVRRVEVGRGTQWLIETPLLHGQSIITAWEPISDLTSPIAQDIAVG